MFHYTRTQGQQYHNRLDSKRRRKSIFCLNNIIVYFKGIVFHLKYEVLIVVFYKENIKETDN